MLSVISDRAGLADVPASNVQILSVPFSVGSSTVGLCLGLGFLASWVFGVETFRLALSSALLAAVSKVL